MNLQGDLSGLQNDFKALHEETPFQFFNRRLILTSLLPNSMGLDVRS